MIFLYLLAIVSADLIVTKFGVSALPYTSFFLIPFDLVVRDVLHDKWRKTGGLVYKMTLLIMGGSALSYAINQHSKNVALGSFSAFVVAGIFATIVYQILKDRPRLQKMNAANFVAAMFDSFVFQIVAFHSVDLKVSILQWTFKFCGGFIWSWLFVKFIRRAQ